MNGSLLYLKAETRGMEDETPEAVLSSESPRLCIHKTSRYKESLEDGTELIKKQVRVPTSSDYTLGHCTG